MPLCVPEISEKIHNNCLFDHMLSYCDLYLSPFDLKMYSLQLCVQLHEVVNWMKFPQAVL